jgi:hypothetical protein
VDHKTVRWQGTHCLLAGGIVGDMYLETRGRQIETILVKKWLAWRFYSKQGYALHHRHDE